MEEADGRRVLPVQVGLVQALARPAVMDYVFEKGTEVGASFFLLVRPTGSPKWAARPRRATGSIRWQPHRPRGGQAEQAGVGPLGGVRRLRRARRSTTCAAAEAWSLVLEPGASVDPRRVRCSDPAVRRARRPVPWRLWIGPEGGWTAGETDAVRAGRVTPARLGRSVLRTETAGPVAVAVTRLAARGLVV